MCSEADLSGEAPSARSPVLRLGAKRSDRSEAISLEGSGMSEATAPRTPRPDNCHSSMHFDRSATLQSHSMRQERSGEGRIIASRASSEEILTRPRVPLRPGGAVPTLGSSALLAQFARRRSVWRSRLRSVKLQMLTPREESFCWHETCRRGTSRVNRKASDKYWEFMKPADENMRPHHQTQRLRTANCGLDFFGCFACGMSVQRGSIPEKDKKVKKVTPCHERFMIVIFLAAFPGRHVDTTCASPAHVEHGMERLSEPSSERHPWPGPHLPGA